MKKINVNLGTNSYPILIEPGISGKMGETLPSFIDSRKGVFITDQNVWELHGSHCFERLKKGTNDIVPIVIPSGERRKSLHWSRRIYDFLIEQRCDRSSFIIAMGGGVIGDLAGFVAATFMRGIPFFQVPTTLLAQVDASIGGKVGVNLPQGKNLVGAFYQPLAVLIDQDVLKTLPKKELRGGMAEVIKYGLIKKGGFFDFLEQHCTQIYMLETKPLYDALVFSCSAKADVVSRDEKESGLRAILNFGHTVGHAIETIGQYRRISHGESVAIGMAAAMRISLKKGFISKDCVERVDCLLRKAKLPVSVPDMDTDEIMSAMQRDKKRIKGKLRFVLLKDIGDPIITDDIPEEIVREVIEELSIK